MTEHEPNALIDESSPYLLQHARNPVAWMPWGDAAFDKAREEDKPVFLSIGYATCHWCHVMERESFEDERIAAFMNEHFVSIKVDREERPDIDSVYMAVTQGLNNGQGGWPMSVWMTPGKLPFMAGTYFPPEDRFGRAGFLSVLQRIAELWKTERDKLVQQANDITEWLRGHSLPEGRAELNDKTFELFAETMKRTFDARHGGFEKAPKFPTPHRLQALIRCHVHSEDTEALAAVEKTLQGMAEGGIHDHLGGGFHRYSTDREWLTPHFEKMLYDQALLTEAYLDAYQVTGTKLYAETARSICRYVLRDLRDESGAFHSAEDADSEGEEGKFYVWTTDELREVLGDDADLAAYVWGFAEAGNYFDESSHERTGANIIHLPRPVADSAKQRDLSENELREMMFEWSGKLFEKRTGRERPLLDDKVLTDWNGLMIGAMARAGVILKDDEYLDAAREAADFILNNMQEDGRLLHRYRKGKAGIKGYAEDYAFMLNGLFALYEADFDPRWLRELDRLAGEMIRLFFHEDEGLLRTQGTDVEDAMIAPNRNTFDGAVPSANSAAAWALLRAGRLLQKDAYFETGAKILEANSRRLTEMPAAHAYALLALEWLVRPTREIVIAGERDDETAKAMLNELQARFLPRAVTVLHEPGNKGGDVRELVPFVENQGPVDGTTAAYVCENYACKAPVTDVEQLKATLGD